MLSHGETNNRLGELLGALANPYRRQLLLALMEHNPQADDDSDPLDIHPEGEDSFTQMNISMGHLPMLDDMGIIDWDQDDNEISKGPDWEEFEPLLQLIVENKERLPGEWFENSNSE